MERKIGEVFEHEGVKLEVVVGESCDDCQIGGMVGCIIAGNCSPLYRTDKTHVIFRKVEPQ